MYNLKGIYLFSGSALHRKYDIVYQDINGYRDIGGDAMYVDLSPYDFVIASPPCNYYSKANYRRDVSDYSLKTKHLLPDIITKLIDEYRKPFLVENVQNATLLPSFYELYNYIFGGHHFYTNIPLEVFSLNPICIHKSSLSSKQRQGDINVFNVVELFLRTIHHPDFLFPFYDADLNLTVNDIYDLPWY